MRHDAILGTELTHFEECACHALADAHRAIQMLAARLDERGLLNPGEYESLRALTDRDLSSVQEIEDHPVSAHSTAAEDEQIRSLLVFDEPFHFWGLDGQALAEVA